MFFGNMDPRIIVALHLVLMVHGHAVDHDHSVCYSKINFQENLLDKMVTLTHRVKTMETQLENKMNKVTEASEKLKENKVAMESNFTQLTSHLKQEIKETTERMIETQGEAFDTNTKKAEDLLKDTAAKFSRLSEDFNGLVNQIKGSGKPNAAFLARTVSDELPYKGTQLVFTNAIHNTDNSYSTRTGEFTAPIGGTYWFSTQICGHNKLIHFRIFANDVMMSDTAQYDSGSSCTSANTVAILSKGDRVYVKTGWETHGGTVIRQGTSRWSAFMGSLVN